jgi:hypothetical protein
MILRLQIISVASHRNTPNLAFLSVTHPQFLHNELIKAANEKFKLKTQNSKGKKET